ncbi:MAG: hypothetical protein EOO09_08240 [Chitinophagaceae bacterium]|nr:MAG: hypothetical protein EOO09_08240 [Chitinophagaceae bacterium]
MDNEIIKQYTNGELTIVWKPAACIHSKNCWNAITGMPQVFDPRKRPWIDMSGGPSSAEMAQQVRSCPSGALSSFYNHPVMQDQGKGAPETPAKNSGEAAIRIKVLPNGPLIVDGHCAVEDAAGNSVVKTESTAFCRCGFSTNKPYCDGSHSVKGFIG